MDQTATARRHADGNGRTPLHDSKGKQNFTAMDHALVKSKRKNRPVIVTLAVTTAFTDEEGDFEATVCHVDSFSVLLNVNGRERWIFKSFMVGVAIKGTEDE